MIDDEKFNDLVNKQSKEVSREVHGRPSKDIIENDDKKFEELVTKQYHHGYEGHSKPSDDVIENDDSKMYDLIALQSLSDEGLERKSSIEEKYEEKILIEQIVKVLDEDDLFEKFFLNKEDEQQ